LEDLIFDAPGDKVLKIDVFEKLLEVHAKNTGITVTDEMLAQAMKRLAAQNNLTEAQILQQLAKDGISEDEFNDQLKAQLAGSRFIERTFSLRIVCPSEYPRALPVVFDTAGYFPRNQDFHTYSDGSFCLGSDLKIKSILKADSSLTTSLIGDVFINYTIKIIKIDVDKNQSVAATYEVRGVPTLILFKEGKQVWRQSGVVQADQLIQWLQNRCAYKDPKIKQQCTEMP